MPAFFTPPFRSITSSVISATPMALAAISGCSLAALMLFSTVSIVTTLIVTRGPSLVALIDQRHRGRILARVLDKTDSVHDAVQLLAVLAPDAVAKNQVSQRP